MFRVLNILSWLLVFLAAAMTLPIGFSLYFGESDYIAFIFSALVTLGVGLGGIFGSRLYIQKELKPKDGFAVVTFGWLSLAVFGALPFLISGAIPGPADAFFETMSGFTTTGATILTDVESLPHGLLLWRSLTHWIGGMGIIVLSLAILPFLGVGGMQLFKAEVPGPVADKLTPRITGTAKILWVVYVALTAAETLLLMLGGMDFFESLCHAFGTMATGGYSTRNASIGAYASAYIDYIIILFMLFAGTNFSLHYQFFRGNFSVYFKNREFCYFISIVLGATLYIGCDNYLRFQEHSLSRIFQDSLFQVVSIITTTGYGTADYEQWSPGVQFLLFFLMFLGGCAGSTSGGMKIIRVFVLFKFILTEIIRLIHPHAVVSVRIGNRVVSRGVIANILGFSTLFFMLFGAGVLIMTTIGLDLMSAFGAIAATLGNIGPGLGSVGPTDNYAHIPDIGKWTLSVLMLMGRLELFTVIVLFSPEFWRK